MIRSQRVIFWVAYVAVLSIFWHPFIGLSADRPGPIAKITGFNDLALEIPRALLKDCVRQVGDLNLEKLQSEFLQIQAYAFFLGFAISADDGRQTGVCRPANKQVIINMLDWRKSEPRTRPLLALHEALCAAGYDDRDYQLSISLWELLQDLTRQKSAIETRPAFKSIKRRHDNLVSFSDGGVTGVGGGGDFTSIELKMDLLHLTLQNKGSERLRQLIVETPMEPARELTQEKQTNIFFSKNKDGKIEIKFPIIFFDDPEFRKAVLKTTLDILDDVDTASIQLPKTVPVLVPGRSYSVGH